MCGGGTRLAAEPPRAGSRQALAIPEPRARTATGWVSATTAWRPPARRQQQDATVASVGQAVAGAAVELVAAQDEPRPHRHQLTRRLLPLAEAAARRRRRRAARGRPERSRGSPGGTAQTRLGCRISPFGEARARDRTRMGPSKALRASAASDLTLGNRGRAPRRDLCDSLRHRQNCRARRAWVRTGTAGRTDRCHPGGVRPTEQGRPDHVTLRAAGQLGRR